MTELAAYTHNGQPISAEAFYAIACDPRRSVAVEACAGAGKTWMLVSRILRALLNQCDGPGGPLLDVAGRLAGQLAPQEILAITFTKKAAGEMRERLEEWLQKFARADDETLRSELVMRGVVSQKDPASPRLLRELLSQLYLGMLANGRPVQIRTFHSWFAALLRSAPISALQQLSLPLNYELLEDDAPAKALVWRRFYAALVADDGLRADFEAVVQACGRSQTDKALQGALDKRTEFLLADACGVVDASVEPVSVLFAEFAALAHPNEALLLSATRAVLLAAAKALGQASAATFSAKGVELETAVTEQNAAGVLTALLTDKGTPRKFGEKIAGLGAIREAQDLVLRVRDAAAQHDAWAFQQRMARLARVLLAEFSALKRERGWVDMNDIERAALVVLTDPVLSGWAQERLDARIRHLMIDEAQDTNPLQWQALSAWLSGYAGAGGQPPSVFMVGDPKQSIYRFRRAEPQVFVAAQAFMVDALGGDVLACDHTRRNSAAVMATINSAMGEAAVSDGYAGFRPHTSASIEAGSVLRLPAIARPDPRPEKPLADSNAAADTAADAPWRDSLTTPRELPEETLRTLEARQAARWLASQVASGIKPKDVMVLSRKRAGLLPLQQALAAWGIDAQIGEKTELIDCCEVQDVVALLDVLVSPHNDLALARALRSPLFALSNDALVRIALAARAQAADSPRSWFGLLQNEADCAPQLRAEFADVAADLAQYKGWVDSLPPHDALQAIYHHRDVLARFAAAAPAARCQSVLANLKAALNAALQLGGGRYATPYALVRALKAGGQQAPASVNPEAMRLLTVHGAKGLEAHTVLLLDTDTAPRSLDSMSVLVDWPAESPAPVKFVFLVSESRPPACAKALMAVEVAARQREELNALYVALSRARTVLAVSSVAAARAAPNSWWQRLHGLAQETSASAVPVSAWGPEASHMAVGGLNAGVETGTPQATTADLLVLPLLPLLPVSPVFSALSLPAEAASVAPSTPSTPPPDSAASRIGQAMHRLLECGAHTFLAPAFSLADAAPAQASAQAEIAAIGHAFRLTPAQLEQAIAAAQRIRRGDGAWVWAHPDLTWQGDELELVHAGQTLRLDRLVQWRGQWWVLDYKSASQGGATAGHAAQLRSYQAALQAIYPGERVRAALLTADGAVVELPPLQEHPELARP